MKNEYITAQGAPKAVGPYSHAVRSGELLFISGQLGVAPETGELADGVEAQARLALQNLSTILAAAGMTFLDLVKTTVFLKDMNDFAAINTIYAEILGEAKPARSCVAVAALPKNGLFEIEAIARRG